MSTPRFWLSWEQPSEDYRPISYPPNEAILGWWCTGLVGTIKPLGSLATLSALVAAETEELAWAAVKQDWPDMGDRRFSVERSGEWIPTDRFALQSWMISRLGLEHFPLMAHSPLGQRGGQYGQYVDHAGNPQYASGCAEAASGD